MRETLVSSPQQTLIILLGASEWPSCPSLEPSKAFKNSANEVKAYFLDHFALPKDNFLDLFDFEGGPNELDKEIAHFLDERLDAMQAVGKSIEDLFTYYIGHGDVLGRSSELCLTLRSTRMENRGISRIVCQALCKFGWSG